MIYVYLLIGGLLITAYIAWMLTLFRRDYLAEWQGHRIQVIHRTFGLDILIDGQLILGQANNETHRIPVSFEPEGTRQLTITPQKHNGKITTMEISIDNELLTVTQAPTGFWGNTIATTPQSLERIATASILDPRYIPAKRLYERIRQQAVQNAEITRELDLIFQTLTDRFLRLQELSGSIEDYRALGTDPTRFIDLQTEQEADITAMLQGLQDLHLHMVEMQEASDAQHTEGLKNILYRLQADIEMA